jgi:hypothetical protein
MTNSTRTATASDTTHTRNPKPGNHANKENEMNVMTKFQPVENALASRAMVVSLSISQWTARRLDRKITDEVNKKHNAADDAGRYNKLLLPKEALDGITSIVSETGAEFRKRTLPWIDNGGRIMSADAFMAHAAWMRGQERKFTRAVEDFLAKYPTYVQEARNRLNGMFDQDDYPHTEVLRSKFSMELKVLPVPSASDFRVAMSQAQADQIRADIERTVNEATANAVKDIYARVAEVTGRMVERLNAYKPAKGKGDKSEGVFRDSLVDNIRDLIDILPALNITGDPALTAMADRLRPLVEHDAVVLRENEGIRRDVAQEAQNILDSVSGFLA